MNIVRGIGRLLLGGFFIVNGAKAVKDPSAFAAAAEPIAERVVPLVRKAVGPQNADLVPENAATLVRINGVASVLGGLGMATGISRRGGASLAALSMLPHVLAANPAGASEEEKRARRSVFVRNLALLGAALVVSQDTAGQPSLAWRADDARQRLMREAERTRRQLEKDASHTGAQLRKDADRLRRKAAKQATSARKGIKGALS